MTAKYEILELMKQIPDDLTVEETIKRLRSAYIDGEVAAIGAISGEQFDHMTMKEKLVHTMNRLPDNLTLGQALIEAMERLLLVYKLERSIEQIREGQTIPHDEVVSMLQERWQT